MFVEFNQLDRYEKVGRLQKSSHVKVCKIVATGGFTGYELLVFMDFELRVMLLAVACYAR